ncbi:SPRY domain-containing protein 7 [Schistosoma haematobium]|uniref:SPRY domain-containing protein 7 n=1 Tax=Schistosoma haematobium TaxID=6185 RepID=A0A922S2C0_SCHHA|nr:SPRY domain-containing protein 7 [Schistosoma haematobium]KAH9590704.1 SPRY domain-containing protein 7 [Schistosoma haematobium]
MYIDETSLAFGCCRRDNIYDDDYTLLDRELMKFYVKLNVLTAAPSVLILKSGLRICSNGAARTNIPIIQDYAYYEVKLQNYRGSWGIGLCTVNAVMIKWIKTFLNDMKIWSRGHVIGQLKQSVEEGDIIGVICDKGELRFTINGDIAHVYSEQTEQSPLCIDSGGEVLYPVLGVGDDTVLDVAFTANSFNYPPLSVEGFGEIKFQKEVTF